MTCKIISQIDVLEQIYKELRDTKKSIKIKLVFYYKSKLRKKRRSYKVHRKFHLIFPDMGILGKSLFWYEIFRKFPEKRDLCVSLYAFPFIFKITVYYFKFICLSALKQANIICLKCNGSLFRVYLCLF